MCIHFPKITLWGVLLVVAFALNAGGGEWFLFRPPELRLELPALRVDLPPGDDDDGGGSPSENIEPENNNAFWAGWNLSMFFGEANGESEASLNDDTASGEVTGTDEHDDQGEVPMDGLVHLIPAFRTDLHRGNLVESLTHYLWLGLRWREMEGGDLVYPDFLSDVLPYLRLYDYEPQHLAWIDPEFIYYFIEQETVITEALNGVNRILYLAARAHWMDVFMGPEDALQAWGELAYCYAESSHVRFVIERLLHLPWQESAWRALSECIKSIEDEKLKTALARLVYAKFRMIHGNFKFSECIPWLLTLPGLLDEERTAVRNYLYILICEQAWSGGVVLDRVHASILSILSHEGDADVWVPFFSELLDDYVYEGSARGYLFLLRVFSMLDAGEDLEILLLNKIALLLYEKGDNLDREEMRALLELVALMKEGMLSEKGYQFCMELLCAPCLQASEIETLRTAAIGSLLACPNLSKVAFQRLWKIYYPVLQCESFPISEAVLQVLPSIICSRHLSPQTRRLLFNRLNNEDAFDGAYVMDLLLNVSAPEYLVGEGLESLVHRIEIQPSDTFWNVVKGRLSTLLSLLRLHEGHFKGYYERIIDALNAIVVLSPNRLYQYPTLMQLREEAIEILFKHYVSFPRGVQKALMLLTEMSAEARDAVFASRLWRWLFIQDVLDDYQVEQSIDFLLDTKKRLSFSSAHECEVLSNALVVLLSRPSLPVELRSMVLRSIYRSLDLRSAVTLLLRGTSWVQDAKVLYGLAHNVAQCRSANMLNQVRLKLIYSGYLRHRVQQAFSVRHCDAVSLRFLHAAKQLLNALGEAALMDLYLEERVRALRTISCKHDLFPEFAEAAASLLERLAKAKLITLEERVLDLADNDSLQK